MYFLTDQKNECFGCQACVDICPKSCIAMQEDENGFRYPVIDRTNCIHCNLCEVVCPHDYQHFIDPSAVKAYICVHDSEDVVYMSSSGGAFTAVYEALLKEGYTVFGAKFTDSLEVVHDSATTAEECEAFRKSKYIQSDTNHSFARIKKLLSSGEKVLFSGTPCQCAGLHSFLVTSKVSMDDICIVSILCHGVPSQHMFQVYKDELARKGKDGQLRRFEFRYKTRESSPVNSRSAVMEFGSGHQKTVTARVDPFLRSYYLRLGYRSSCATCEFSRQDRVADITIGDAWKIEQLFPALNPLLGVSLILSATEQGDHVLSKLNGISLTEISAEWALNSQGVLKHPTAIHEKTDRLYALIPKIGFRAAVFRLTDPPFVKRVLSKMKSIVKRVLKH